MAAPLDLQEQEQLDQLKHFWGRFGGLMTTLLLLALLAVVGWNGWQWWQGRQAAQAAGLFEQLDRAASAGNAAQAQQAFKDLTASYPGTAWAAQGALVNAKVQQQQGKAAEARAALEWVAANASDADHRWVAKLRLAAVLLDAKEPDAALRQLDGVAPTSFAALVADRRADILQTLGKRPEAIAAYQSAWRAMPPELEYRRLIEAKLNALGTAPDRVAAAASGASQ